MATETSYAFKTCTVVMDNKSGDHIEHLVCKDEIFAIRANRCDGGNYFVTVYGRGSSVCFYLDTEEQYIEFRTWCMQP